MNLGIFATLYWRVDWDVVEDIDNIISRHTDGKHGFDNPVTIGLLPTTIEEIEKYRQESTMPFTHNNEWYLHMFNEIRRYWDAGKASKVLFM